MEEALSYFISTRFIISVLIVIAALIAIIITKKLVTKSTVALLERYGKDNRSSALIHIVSIVIIVVIVIIAVLSILQINDIKVSSLITAFGVMGAILTVALQGVLQDLSQGWRMGSDEFFRLGDVVRIGEVEGEVVSFTLQTTKIRNLKDNSIVSISNRLITQAAVLPNEAYLSLQASYSDDQKEVQTALRRVCERVAKEKRRIADCSLMGINGLDADGIDYLIQIHCNPAEKLQCKRDFMAVLYEEFSACGLDFPFRQVTVHLGEPPVSAAEGTIVQESAATREGTVVQKGTAAREGTIAAREDAAHE